MSFFFPDTGTRKWLLRYSITAKSLRSRDESEREKKIYFFFSPRWRWQRKPEHNISHQQSACPTSRQQNSQWWVNTSEITSLSFKVFPPPTVTRSVWQKDEICVRLCFCHLEGKTEAGLVVTWQKWEGMAKMINNNNNNNKTEIKWTCLRQHERETGTTKTTLHNSHLPAVLCLCYLRQKLESIKERLCSRACQSVRKSNRTAANGREGIDTVGWYGWNSRDLYVNFNIMVSSS